MKLGRAVYPWVGIQSYMDIDPALSQQMGLPPVRGILIFEIAAGSPADRARLRGGDPSQVAYYQRMPILLGGDVILAMNDVPTPTYKDFESLLDSKNVGDQVRVKILRGSKEFTVDMVLSEDPRVRS
jgi:S1-C subfamily serine protease